MSTSPISHKFPQMKILDSWAVSNCLHSIQLWFKIKYLVAEEILQFKWLSKKLREWHLRVKNPQFIRTSFLKKYKPNILWMLPQMLTLRNSSKIWDIFCKRKTSILKSIKLKTGWTLRWHVQSPGMMFQQQTHPSTILHLKTSNYQVSSSPSFPVSF